MDDAETLAEASPRLVTRGESITSPTPNNPKAALIDWLNFTFPFDNISADRQRISQRLDDQLFAAFGYATTRFRNKGHLGYSDFWDLGNGFGILATGGKSQGNTCLISLNGGGCMPIQDWRAVHDLLVLLNAKITRVDLAHDDFAGDYNITAGLEMLALGQFTTNGRPPNAMFVDDFDSGKGKTLYIGNRDSGKLLRVYEKGKQLGDPLSPWVRWELELHNKDRSIPLDVLLRPGDYLAGGYPCLAWVSETQDRIKTTRNQLKISFDHLVKHCRQSYGKLLYVMHEGLGQEPLDIVQALSVAGIPSRLDLRDAIPVEQHIQALVVSEPE
ncbi:probable phage replication protein NMA0782 [Methylomonas albis]|nr:probable phage replication protein NMA0782 [Methylomonas albis]